MKVKKITSLSPDERLRELSADAADASAEIRIVSFQKSDAPTLSRRLHQVKGAVNRLRATIALIEGGYRFDDEEASEITSLLREAALTLSEEATLWEQIYPSPL